MKYLYLIKHDNGLLSQICISEKIPDVGNGFEVIFCGPADGIASVNFDGDRAYVILTNGVSMDTQRKKGNTTIFQGGQL